MKISRGVLGFAAMAITVGLATWAVFTVMPPAPVAADAPAQVFSAQRAFAHVEVVAEQPHPTGSTAAAEVRDYIVDELTALGLEPEVQRSVGASGNLGAFTLANVQNVVATIEGTESTGTVYLTTHYDSVTWSYGANDDGVGVATLLETARAVLAGEPPKNDIVLLFTDAEEACLCGAEAYVNDNPNATGVVLNFEARGSSGPAIMFETSRGNAGVVGVYAAAVEYPVATSFAVEVYRILPNDTDFSPFRDSGRFTGLNSAYIDGAAAYHSQQDSLANFSNATLQHHGSSALAMTRAFGNANLATLAQPSPADATYFPVLGMLVTYPGSFVWPIAILALVVVLAAIVVVVRRERSSVGTVAASVGLTLVLLVTPAALVYALTQVLLTWQPSYGSLGEPWSPWQFRVAIVCFVAAIVVGWILLLRRKLGAESLAVGALFWLGALGIVLAAVTPGGSYLLAIPALVGGIVTIVRASTSNALVGALCSLVAAAVGLVILAPTVALFFPALGFGLAAVPAFLATLAALAAVPVTTLWLPDRADRSRKSRSNAVWVPAGFTLWGVLTLLMGVSVNAPSPSQPTPVGIMYALDADTGEAYWVRRGSDPTGWSGALVNEQRDLSQQLPLVASDAMVGTAAPLALSAPEVTVLLDAPTATGREVILHITPRADSRWVYVQTTEGAVLAGAAGGREIAAGIDGQLKLFFYSVPAEGLELTLELRGAAPVTAWITDATAGLEDVPGFVPRPPEVSIANSRVADMVVVATTTTF